ncbi:hypothetical protein GCM10009567_06160 [Rothia amarae]
MPSFVEVKRLREIKIITSKLIKLLLKIDIIIYFLAEGSPGTLNFKERISFWGEAIESTTT